MNLPRPPFPVVAAGICPQGLSPGQLAPNVVGCTAQNGGTGLWIVLVTDPTILVGNSVCIPAPGSGSNLAKGVSFGQAQQQIVGGFSQFTFQVYRNDTGAAVDLECQFVIVKWPPLT